MKKVTKEFSVGYQAARSGEGIDKNLAKTSLDYTDGFFTGKVINKKFGAMQSVVIAEKKA